MNSFMIHSHRNFLSFSLTSTIFSSLSPYSFSIPTIYNHKNTTLAHPTPMQQANRNHNHNHPRNTNISLELPSHDHRSNNNSHLFMLDMTESYPDPDEQFSSMTSFTEEEASSPYQHGNKTCVATKSTCVPDLSVNANPASDTFSWLNCEWPTSDPYPYSFLGRVFSILEWLVFKVVAPCLRHRREPHNPIYL
ncbi:MAG: hypothetical protein JOS17DRAFT_731588 [Linnemannia elongata]|nr:MAG: hypothetical protein JOS17DRAFT_731588 [Linnemannia elongata]